MSADSLEKLSEVTKTPTSQLKFIMDAWSQIVECRRQLKWTYAYGYYAFSDERQAEQQQAQQRTFFEFLQVCVWGGVSGEVGGGTSGSSSAHSSSFCRCMWGQHRGVMQVCLWGRPGEGGEGGGRRARAPTHTQSPPIKKMTLAPAPPLTWPWCTIFVVCGGGEPEREAVGGDVSAECSQNSPCGPAPTQVATVRSLDHRPPAPSPSPHT